MLVFLVSSEIAYSFAQAVHFNTFGGNPVASAVGKAVLEVLTHEAFQSTTVFAVVPIDNLLL